MKLLLISATESEIAPLAGYLAGLHPFSGNNVSISTIITGVGMVSTTYSLMKALQAERYDFVLQAGVAGSYDRNISLGEVVFVVSEQFGDLGAEDHDNYLDVFEMGLVQKDAQPFLGMKLFTPLSSIHEKIPFRRAHGLTINTVSGRESTIKMRSEKYGADVESMEGAAFHYVCLKERIAFAQIRAISNYVMPRDKSQWKMKEAIINLNKGLIGFIESL